MVKVRHITYASQHYTMAARQLRRTARRFGLETFAYTPAHPVVSRLSATHSDIMSQPRGNGYWLWKPHIILDALENSDDDTIVIYTDAAMHVIADPRPMLRYALAYPIMIFEHIFPVPAGPVAFPQSMWTKRDCFVLLDADTPRFWHLQQAMGGLQIYRNSKLARDFVRELTRAVADIRVLTDMPNTQGLPNLEGFRDHRHDQSVLTIIAHKHGLQRFPDPTQHGHDHPRPAIYPSLDGQTRPAADFFRIFNLHRKRDHTVLQHAIRTLRPTQSGNWNNCETELDLSAPVPPAWGQGTTQR